ncbi:MAG: IS66 family insertion sequence element accessory protein TnpB [Myxococcales bacterium]|nr:IS66 family insertion sequence element accessory protein TnpB [Myxococcales bacterium]
MIPRDVEVLVALGPVNTHLSFDRLAALVTESLGRDPRSPALHVFLNPRRTLLKALFFDGTGLCVFYKRLDRGRFAPIYQKKRQGGLEPTPSECALLLEGSERVGRFGLSPPLLKHRDLSSRMKR